MTLKMNNLVWRAPELVRSNAGAEFLFRNAALAIVVVILRARLTAQFTDTVF